MSQINTEIKGLRKACKNDSFKIFQITCQRFRIKR